MPSQPGATAGVFADATDVRQKLPATSASGIAKAVLLRAKLPRIPAGDAAAAFARENATAMPDAVATARRPLYPVWLAGQYFDRATQQIGTIPTATSPVLRALMLADSASTAAGYVSIAPP